MMKKRLIALIMTLCLAFAMVLPVGAVSTENLEGILGSTEDKELDAYREMQQLSEEKLREGGLTPEEIKEVKENSYEDAVLELAQLSDDTLFGYGYSNEEIEVLRDYTGEEITKESEVYAILPTCTTAMYCTSATNRSFVLHYNWSWNKIPVFAGTDTVVIRWAAINGNAQYIDVTQSNVYAIIDYYTSSGTKSATIYPRYPADGSFFISHGEDNAMQCKFNVLKSGTWAKQGAFWITVSLDSSVQASISYIKVRGAYGHGKVQGTPSVNFGGEGPSISFSFSKTTESLGALSYKITNTGSKTPI